jgi:hypothetical protein
MKPETNFTMALPRGCGFGCGVYRVPCLNKERTEMSITDDPRAFERFLRDQGYSRMRAKAITARGFDGNGASPAEDGCIDSLVSLVHQKRLYLPVEEKSRKQVGLMLHRGWSRRERFPVFRASAGDKIRISAVSMNKFVRGLAAPFELKVFFTAPGGRREEKRWLSHGGRAGNGPYAVAEGMQEVEVSGFARTAPQRVMVFLDLVR